MPCFPPGNPVVPRHVAMLLEALSSAYRLGAEELLPVTLKAFKKREVWLFGVGRVSG